MLENSKIDIKIKLAVLWASVTLCYLYGDYFELYTPEKIESLSSGQNVLNSPTKLLTASVILSVPSVMVALSVLLPAQINRILNIIFGSIFTLMMIIIGISSFIEWYSFYVFLAFLESIITFSVVWYAVKWPRTLKANQT
ncbi:DUF6326 family protein [Roseivirga pacifica]|uniref:DUF6326 family protein n=1 Tax=Roseivirga pacifica TaxID=1267423 RepID=UPI003BB133FB